MSTWNDTIAYIKEQLKPGFNNRTSVQRLLDSLMAIINQINGGTLEPENENLWKADVNYPANTVPVFWRDQWLVSNIADNLAIEPINESGQTHGSWRIVSSSTGPLGPYEVKVYIQPLEIVFNAGALYYLDRAIVGTGPFSSLDFAAELAAEKWKLIADGHIHTNLSVIDSLSVVDGKLAYNGVAVDTINAAGVGVFLPVADLTALKAIDTTTAADWPDKWLIHVETLGLYALDRESSAAADDNLVISPVVGAGRWIKKTGFSAEDHDHAKLVADGSNFVAPFNKTPGTYTLATIDDLGESNTTSNAGLTGAGLALAKSGVDLPFKRIAAGTNIKITENIDHIVVASSGGATLAVQDEGVALTAGGTAINFIGAGVTSAFDSTNNKYNVDIPGGSSGEANTTSNAGVTGAGLALAKSGVDLPFKRIAAGTNVTITENADHIVVAASGGGSAGQSIRDFWCNPNLGDVTEHIMAGKISAITVRLGRGLSANSWEVSLNNGTWVAKATADLQAWIDANVTGSQATGTLWNIRPVPTYAAGVNYECAIKIVYTVG